ncbi:hypothetical protein PV367_07360 [Streptomyces europaeiscabiei]|uniref:Uncharacterized protein n=1 Tax=Streptomyces europaeiscabiei TaxID=146819 RepID=A0AAJ2PM59_9ACTN|nr:hypothetical protein [Streptomyces europaeiscabiei]MDX3129617.1 hypothetical protein [Streptomyces europaeiscabiei]
MSVHVTKTSGHTAEITWDPKSDDPQGYLATAIEGDQLAYALEALGDPDDVGLKGASPESALQAAVCTAQLAALLERRSALQVVRLRDVHKLSWRRIAAAILDDPEKQSSVRRMYDSGRRHLPH